MNVRDSLRGSVDSRPSAVPRPVRRVPSGVVRAAAWATLLAAVPAFAESLSCDSICANTGTALQSLIADPACKNDPKCVACVGTAIGGDQITPYCTGYQSTGSSNTKQVISAAMFTATAIGCGVACAMTTVPGLQQACGYAGLATTVTDLALTFDATNLSSSLMGAMGGVATVGKNLEMIRGKVSATTGQVQGLLKKVTKVPACGSAIIYGALAATKSMSLAAMKGAKGRQCATITKLQSTVTSAIPACRAASGAAAAAATSSSAIVSIATGSFLPPTLADGIKQASSATGPAENYLKKLGPELEKAEAAGLFDFKDIARRLDAGESPADVIASAGLPADVAGEIKTNEQRIRDGEKSNLLGALLGGVGGYAGGAAAPPGPAATTELGFGAMDGGATPGEAGEALGFDRAPATRKSRLSGNDDVFHASFSGTIFDIVSERIQEQKGNVAELELEGRMNRIFNGYGDPLRKPAAAARAPAKSARVRK